MKSSTPKSSILWAARLLVMAALLVSAGLLLLSLTGKISSLAGCGGEGGCANLLGGRWSKWFGWPVTLGAVPLYLAFLIASFRWPLAERSSKQPARPAAHIMVFSILTAVAAAVWFLFIAFVVEKAFCP